jgi:hypothetical protein
VAVAGPHGEPAAGAAGAHRRPRSHQHGRSK